MIEPQTPLNTLFMRLPSPSYIKVAFENALAYDEYNYDSGVHSLRVAELHGANVVELATFTGGTLYPIVWSPDNKQLAFAYYTEATQSAPTADVHIINRDGKGLKQVYRGVSVGSILFSPDGKHLLINETSSPTG